MFTTEAQPSSSQNNEEKNALHISTETQFSCSYCKKKTHIIGWLNVITAENFDISFHYLYVAAFQNSLASGIILKY